MIKTAKECKVGSINYHLRLRQNQITLFEVPGSYANLAKQIKKMKDSEPETKYISWETFTALAKKNNIFCPVNVQLVSDFLCKLLFYYFVSYTVAQDTFCTLIMVTCGIWLFSICRRAYHQIM